jgi:hypothetical protein
MKSTGTPIITARRKSVSTGNRKRARKNSTREKGMNTMNRKPTVLQHIKLALALFLSVLVITFFFSDQGRQLVHDINDLKFSELLLKYHQNIKVAILTSTKLLASILMMYGIGLIGHFFWYDFQQTLRNL